MPRVCGGCLGGLGPPTDFLTENFFLFVSWEGLVFRRLTVARTLQLSVTRALRLVFFMFHMEALRMRRLAISFGDWSINASAIGRPAIITSGCNASNGIFRAFFRHARDICIGVINQLIRRRRIAFFLRYRNRIRAIAFAAEGRAARFFLIEAERVGTARMYANVRVTIARAGRIIATASCLMCNLIQIGILILLICVNRFRDLSCFGLTFVRAFRSRGRTRRHHLSNAIQASGSRSAIEQRRRIRIIRGRFVTVHLNRVLNFSGLISRAQAIQGGSFRLFFLLLRVFIRRFIMQVRADLALNLADLEDRTRPFRLTFRHLAAFTNYLLFRFRALNLLLRPT